MKTIIRITSLILCLLTLLCSLSGCDSLKPPTKTEEENDIYVDSGSGFEVIHITQNKTYAGKNNYDLSQENYMVDIYLREKLTDVVYIWRSSGVFGAGATVAGEWASGLTVMMDPKTGGPLTYDTWLIYMKGTGARFCSGCSKVFQDGDIPEYCPDCGASVSEETETRLCPDCGVKTDSKYCADCGTLVSND